MRQAKENEGQPRISRFDSDRIYKIDNQVVRNHSFAGGQLAFVLLDILHFWMGETWFYYRISVVDASFSEKHRGERVSARCQAL